MRRPSAVAVVVLVSLAACGRCARDPAAAPERHLPAAHLAVVIPHLGEAARQAREVLATASKFPAAAWIPSWTDGVRAQLGFDPFSEEGLESAGIDPGGGAAYAEAAGGALLVLPIGDGSAFDGAVARLARDRMGASHRTEAQRGAARVVALAREAGAAPELAYAVAGRVAILARGPRSAEAVTAVATLAEGDTLAASPSWRAARDALGRGHSVLVYRGPRAAPAGTLAALTRDGAAVGLAGTAQRVTGRAVLLLGEGREAAWREVIGSPSREAGEDFESLPRDAFLAARFGGDPLAAGRRALWTFPEVARALEAAGVNAEEDVLPAFAPGAAVAVSLAPTFDVRAFSRRARDAALEDPFRLFHVSAFARTTSPERARAAVEALAKAARAEGFAVTESGEPAESWTLVRGEGRIDVALAEDRLLVAGGPRRLEQLQELVGGDGWRAPTQGARGLATGGAAALVVDFGNLVRSSRALPQSAYGTGPDAFVMRSIAERVLDPASRLEVAAARADLVEGAVRADFVLEAREGAEPRR